MELLSQGAEATVYADAKHVFKHRRVKSYRHPALDRKLRYERMHREANLLEKLAALGIAAPRLIERDEQQATLTMERIPGVLLRDALDRNWKRYAPVLGKRIAQLHAAEIIHGDLTTSNMIVRAARDSREKTNIALIDFGLSFVSQKVEDRAVDLHLLRQALESKHHTVAARCYRAIIATYVKHYAAGRAVVQRLTVVELRGRYKTKKNG